MCGLVGIMQTGSHGLLDERLLSAMNEAQWHRGPDEGGLHIEDGIGLGHRRLSIIDRADGHQPLANEDGSVIVVFNGEIYNYRELREQLLALGHRFATQSDTEVIVHAWESWGRACVNRFRGMFAFALWDRRQGQLLLARDRLGIKPLYYALLGNGDLVFASELKALRQHPAFPTKLNQQAIEEYFGFGYVPEPKSIYEGVYKLPPGHTLLLEQGKKGLPEPQQFWDVPFRAAEDCSDAAAIERLQALLRESVDCRLIAEVPLGAFLSGGVDSSSVVATMAGLTEDPVNTCSIAFGEADFDESAYAQAVAERYATHHHVDRVDPDDYSLLDRLVDLYDEPFADSSALPTYRVCELAKKRVTVALSGDGGDEVLGGYRRYGLHLDDLARKQKLPGVARQLLGGLGRIFPDGDAVPPGLRKRQGLLSLAQDEVTAFFEINAVMKNDLRAQLYSDRFKSALQGYRADQVSHRHARNFAGDDSLSLAQYLDMKTYLPGDILTKVDRASMAHALEVRVPLLDHKLIEWAAGLGADKKRRDGEGKWLLKKAMQPQLPDDVLYRPKRGFAVPLNQWFKGPLKSRVEQALGSEVLADAGIFQPRALQKMWARHLAGQGDFSPQIWSLLMFESFLRKQQA